MPLLSIAIHGWFFILLIIHLARYKNPKPLIIQLIIIIIWIYTPFTNIYIKLDFLIYKDDRKQVIELIEHKNLIPNVSYDNNQIHLPPKFKATSKGGRRCNCPLWEEKCFSFLLYLSWPNRQLFWIYLLAQ